MEKNSKIYIAGHRGLVGSAIVRKLTANGYSNIITQTRSELDLLDQQAVTDFFATEKPDYVFLAAAKVGGIMANKTYPADFIYENLQIQNNIIHNAYRVGVQKLLFLGSSCIYPKLAPQPIGEDSLLTGPLEPTNDAYALAKIAGIKMCQSYNQQYGTNFISVMPTNLYGPNDNFDLETSHVLPALIRRFHEAKQNNIPSATLWGSGTPMREFLHVDDLAAAVTFLMQTYTGSDIINIGTGKDVTIKELAETIQNVVGYTGTIEWDTTKPDGTPRKLLNVDRLHNLGFKHTISLHEGIEDTYQWYINTVK
jgi:GDP-L-fucose synthase